jgi:hypothetical protein
MWNFVFDFRFRNFKLDESRRNLPNIVLISTLTDNKISIEIINEKKIKLPP